MALALTEEAASSGVLLRLWRLVEGRIMFLNLYSSCRMDLSTSGDNTVLAVRTCLRISIPSFVASSIMLQVFMLKWLYFVNADFAYLPAQSKHRRRRPQFHVAASWAGLLLSSRLPHPSDILLKWNTVW